MTYNPASEAKFLFEFLDVDYDLSVVGFDVEETVSETFVINLTLAGREKIKFEDVKLQEGVLTVLGGVGAVLNDDSEDRYFHGIVRKFKHTGTSERLQIYEAQMVPSLWLLSLEEKCRIFQDKPLKEIIETLLYERDIASDMYELRLARDDIFIKFSIQYQETNLHYLSRLLEHEGIFYFFEHFEDKHILVFCDTDAYYRDITGRPFVTFNTNGLVAEKENISTFDFSERIRPGKVSQKNFNFKTPSADLTTRREGEKECAYEVYEYPGPYGEKGRGETMSQIRLEEIQALAMRGSGSGNCPRLRAGAVFNLTDHPHPDFNTEYFLYSVTHSGAQPQILQEHGVEGNADYSNSFLVIPSSVIYRPERRHEKPTVPGFLSAIVTGPKGEEIWPDKYGRVNVQFHFDREGKKDEKSSCWLRVVQFWNGPTWGSQFIPRVGDEVLVSFINGDMDYPVVMGSAVNAAKMPNYSLPANKTQSGFKTKTHKGDGFHELRFDDDNGKEEIYLQSEKDWNILVKNRRGETVGGDSGTVISKNCDLSVGGDSYIIVKGKSTEKAKEFIVGADDKITIVSGKSSLVISPSSIELKSPFVRVNCCDGASMPDERPVSGCTGKGGGFSSGGTPRSGKPSSTAASAPPPQTPKKTTEADPTASPTGEDTPLGNFQGNIPSGGWAGTPATESALNSGGAMSSASGLGDLVSSGAASPLLKGVSLPTTGDLVSTAGASLPGDLVGSASRIASVVQNPESVQNAVISEGRSKVAQALDKASGIGAAQGAIIQTEQPGSLLGGTKINPDDLIKKM